MISIASTLTKPFPQCPRRSRSKLNEDKFRILRYVSTVGTKLSVVVNLQYNGRLDSSQLFFPPPIASQGQEIRATGPILECIATSCTRLPDAFDWTHGFNRIASLPRFMVASILGWLGFILSIIHAHKVSCTRGSPETPPSDRGDLQTWVEIPILQWLFHWFLP